MTDKTPVQLPELPNQEDSLEKDKSTVLNEHDMENVVGGDKFTSRPPVPWLH